MIVCTRAKWRHHAHAFTSPTVVRFAVLYFDLRTISKGGREIEGTERTEVSPAPSSYLEQGDMPHPHFHAQVCV